MVGYRSRWTSMLLVVMAAFLLEPLAAQGKADTITLNGAGSSFDNPLFSKAFSEYTKTNSGVRINYQSVGSGAGIKQLTEKTVDFGATDAPMTAEQLKAAGGADAVIHVPVTLGAVAITYNLPGLKEPVKLSGEVLSGLFMGTIKKWNDDKIATLNSGAELPSTDVTVVHRSDGSGTTDILSTYLAAVSPDWKSKVGSGLSLKWPVGIGGKGNEGVAGQVKQTEGAIGYNELSYATQNKIAYAAIQNSEGESLQASADGATACAAQAAANMPADLRVKIAGCTGKGVYPISGFSWIVLYTDQKDEARGKALVEAVNWLITDGQQYGKDLSYAPLPDQVVKLSAEKLQTVTSGGKTLLAATPAA